jgi:hypothetical protein
LVRASWIWAQDTSQMCVCFEVQDGWVQVKEV